MAFTSAMIEELQRAMLPKPRGKNLLELPTEILTKIVDESIPKWDIFLWEKFEGHKTYWRRESRASISFMKHKKLDPIVARSIESKFSGTLVIRGGSWEPWSHLPQYLFDRKDDIIKIIYRAPDRSDRIPLVFDHYVNLREIVLIDRNYHQNRSYVFDTEPDRGFSYDSVLNGALDENITSYIAWKRRGNWWKCGFWNRVGSVTTMPARQRELCRQHDGAQAQQKSVVAIIEIPGRLMFDNKLEKAKVCISSRLNIFNSTPFEWTVKLDQLDELCFYPVDQALIEKLVPDDFFVRH